MKDFPVFPCSDGMASLILREIPYRGEAYIRIRSVFGSRDGLVRTCADFCRQAGAKQIYLAADETLEGYPVYARLIERSLDKDDLPHTRATAEITTDPQWVTLYNERFRNVPAAKTYLQTPPNAYFVRLDGERIGLGQLIDDELAAVAALKRGCGYDCVCALAAHIRQPRVRLLCAEENLPATRLYDRMGFSRDGTRSVWYVL